MRAILVQHGEAVTKDSDPERPLTERGRREVDALATCLSQRGQLPRTIWHSGKTRARQSAELLSAAAPPQARDGLGPNDDTAAWAEQLAQASADLMLVGHQPFVGRLAARLLTGRDDGVDLGFVPGAACCLERGDDADWRLAWMLRPELLPGT